MKVSVIIPAFNEVGYIEKTLKSVMNQETNADEIIVINNNSQDKTADVAKKMGARVVNEKIQGMIPARNRGFDEAKYDIIARTDADTVVSHNWIKKIKENFKKRPIDALSGPVTYIDLPLIFKSPVASKLYLESLKTISGGKRFLIGMNMSLKTETWKKVKGKVVLDDSKVHEDIDLSIKITEAGGKIGYDPSLVVFSSARRIVGKPKSFFIEYPIRMIKTFVENRNHKS